jgi:L-threonylcarbamoyladenylate synthase
LKGRDRGKPISVLVASRAMLDEIVDAVTAVAERLIERFWPGALTLAFAAKPHASSALSGGGRTIAARISSEPIAQAIVERLRRPLTATSANPGGAPAAVDVAAARVFVRASMFVDGGAPWRRWLDGIDCSTDVPRLIREGAVRRRHRGGGGDALAAE